MSQLELVQQEEEARLQDALAALAEGKLPVRAAPSAGGPEDSSLQFGEPERRRRPKFT